MTIKHETTNSNLVTVKKLCFKIKAKIVTQCTSSCIKGTHPLSFNLSNQYTSRIHPLSFGIFHQYTGKTDFKLA